MFNKPHMTVYPIEEEYLKFLTPPQLASKNLAPWMKGMPSYYTPHKSVDENNDPTTTIKKCMPVIDSMTAGYHILLPCDVWVKRVQDDYSGEGVDIKWALSHLKLVELHKKEQLVDYPLDDSYEQIIFKWINPWIIETRKGWSTLFITPLHHPEIPFYCFPGLVDTDKFPIPVNFPFLIKKGFEGLIPKGTPIIQMIPVKREKTNCVYKKYNKKFLHSWFKASSVFFNIYKKHFHQKKEYTTSESKCPFSKLISR